MRHRASYGNEPKPLPGKRSGKVSIRYAGTLRHLGIGRAHTGTPDLMLIHDREVSISDANTGELIAEHLIDPSKHYQPRKA